MTAITVKLSKTNRCRTLINSTSPSLYRLDAAKQQTAGVTFSHRPKSRFFAPQGRVVAQIQDKLGMADGHQGVLGCEKI